MAQVFLSAGFLSAATVAAAIDAGQFGARSAHKRVLVISNTSSKPEITPALDRMLGFEALRDRFDRVVSWNETIRPYHPLSWSPRAEDQLLWQRMIREKWGLGDGPVELISESIEVNPARAIASIFNESPIVVCAPGLTSYGPTRNGIPLSMAQRITRLVHLALVPGLTPMLLSEHEVDVETVDDEAFAAVASQVAASSVHSGPSPWERLSGSALLLGQSLSDLGVLTVEEEDDLHVRMLRSAVLAGHKSIIFKLHPRASVRLSKPLEEAAAELEADLTVLDVPVPAETLYQLIDPALVVGCFSSALLTAARYYHLPVARVGTELLLEKLSPYHHSDRVPLTVVNSLLPSLEVDEPGDSVEIGRDFIQGVLQPLILTVGYVMQPTIYEHLREAAAEFLRQHYGAEESVAGYFKRRRLRDLELLEGIEQQSSSDGLPESGHDSGESASDGLPRSDHDSGESAWDGPSQREPASEEPVSEEPVSEEPASGESASEEPASGESASEEPASGESASEERESEERESEERASGESASEERVSEEPASHEAVSEEPASGAPVSVGPTEPDSDGLPEGEPVLDEDPAGDLPSGDPEQSDDAPGDPAPSGPPPRKSLSRRVVSKARRVARGFSG